MTTRPHTFVPPANLAVLRGDVVSTPTRRVLPSGAVVVQFDLRTESVDGSNRRVSAPISWSDPSAAALRPVVADAEILVVGSVRRRFFRVGGATQSRTEVVAEVVVPTRRRARVQAVLADLTDRLAC